MEIGNDVINCGMNDAPQSMGCDWVMCWATSVCCWGVACACCIACAVGVGWGDREGGRESLYSTKPLQEL